MKTSSSRIPGAIRGAAICAAVLATLPAFALAPAAELPPEHQQGAIAWRSGGVGQDEAQAMQAAAGQYPLQLEFVVREGGGHGAFIAGVDVAIRDRAGRQMLQATTDGPFLLARLPTGRYVVTATYENTRRERRVAVPAIGSERVVFDW